MHDKKACGGTPTGTHTAAGLAECKIKCKAAGYRCAGFTYNQATETCVTTNGVDLDKPSLDGHACYVHYTTDLDGKFRQNLYSPIQTHWCSPSGSNRQFSILPQKNGNEVRIYADCCSTAHHCMVPIKAETWTRLVIQLKTGLASAKGGHSSWHTAVI